MSEYAVLAPGPRAWGTRLSDAMRAALAAGDSAGALRLATRGDGLARDLAREYGLMTHGLVLTCVVLLRQLRDAAESSAAGDRAGAADRVDPEPLRRRLLDALGGGASCEQALGASQRRLMHQQAEQARAVTDAIAAGDPDSALASLDAKDRAYLAWHDPVVRFMADCFAWVFSCLGPDALVRFHLVTAEGQRAGFDKWEAMSDADFAAATAFLLRQHMGWVRVSEDAQRFTFRQSPCGSGGRLRQAGAYAGPAALPMVDAVGPLTFGEPDAPVYCTHCAIWNGSAPLRWYGRAHWVFEQPGRADGGCVMHLYRRRAGTPAEYTRRVALTSQADAQ